MCHLTTCDCTVRRAAKPQIAAPSKSHYPGPPWRSGATHIGTCRPQVPALVQSVQLHAALAPCAAKWHQCLDMPGAPGAPSMGACDAAVLCNMVLMLHCGRHGRAAQQQEIMQYRHGWCIEYGRCTTWPAASRHVQCPKCSVAAGSNTRHARTCCSICPQEHTRVILPSPSCEICAYLSRYVALTNLWSLSEQPEHQCLRPFCVRVHLGTVR